MFLFKCIDLFHVSYFLRNLTTRFCWVSMSISAASSMYGPARDVTSQDLLSLFYICICIACRSDVDYYRSIVLILLANIPHS